MSGGRFEDLCDVAGPVSRETFDAVQRFESLFVTWASRINLVAPSTLPDVWRRHILDSAQLWPLIPPDARGILDLGSGGGFPGLVLAILLKHERPGGWIALVDSNRKKASFLQAVIGQFSLPAKVYGQRIEHDTGSFPKPDVVTARALSALPELLAYASPWLAGGATGLFHKGRDYQREVEESSHIWRFDLVEHPSKISPDSVVLEISRLQRR